MDIEQLRTRRVAFLVGLVRGFTVVVLSVFLSSLVLPVGLSWLGAEMRTGRGAASDCSRHSSPL